MKTRTTWLAGALAGMVLAAPAAATPDPVVFIEIAKGYQGLLWDGGGLPGVLPGTGIGSAFVVDAAAALEGLGVADSCSLQDDRLLVITNEHIARNAYEISVTFLWEQDGGAARQFSVAGTVIALDQRTDLAVIAVDAGALAETGLDPSSVPAMRLRDGDPTGLEQGARVHAFGNPGGLKRVMTSGVVSAPLQVFPASITWLPPVRLVQTDVAINRGNSGGPLVLASTGDVVAVNFMGGGQNMNFAIPARRLRTLLAQLACGGGIRHGGVPFRHTPVDSRIRSALRLPEVAGEVVLDPVGPRGRPVEGIQALDVVVGVKGRLQPEAGGGEASFRIGPGGVPLTEAVFDLEPGSEAELQILRDGELTETRIEVATLDPQSATPLDHVEFLGAYLERVADWNRVGTHYDGEGLVCGHVLPGSIAAQLGLSQYDIVERVLLRSDGSLRAVEVTGVSSLQDVADEIEGEVLQARASGASVVLGVETYNLESRDRKVKLLRTAPSVGP